jgi:hypothetical protein
MKRLIILTALLALVLTSVLAAQSTLRRAYRDLDVDVWTDRDDGSNYYEGDDITIYFRASEDAYVTIYDLDTRGNVNLIFPPNPGDNHYVQAGEIYMVPESSDDYSLTLEGPPGNEHIQMVASTEYFPVPDWRGPVSVYEKDWGFKYDGENENFIARVNQKYFAGDNFAFDHVGFYVAPKYYYKPVQTAYSGDGGRVYVDYPNGCEVYVDGVFYGYAPLYMPSIYLGRHRMTVYWGSSLVYNDWIFVDVRTPFFVYTRPWFVYNYCWDRWYRNYAWDSYYNGPSRYKYKQGDFYSASKPQVRRGYEVVANDHAKYTKSKFYAGDKETRITKYKETYGYDTKTKTFTTGKSARPDEIGKKKYYNGDAYGGSKRQGSKDQGDVGKRQPGDKRIGNDGAVSRKGSTGRDYVGKKEPVSGQKKGSNVDNRKPVKPSSGDAKKQPQAKPKSDSGSKPSAPAVKERSGSSGGEKSSGSSSPSSPGKPSGGGKKH